MPDSATCGCASGELSQIGKLKVEEDFELPADQRLMPIESLLERVESADWECERGEANRQRGPGVEGIPKRDALSDLSPRSPLPQGSLINRCSPSPTRNMTPVTRP